MVAKKGEMELNIVLSPHFHILMMTDHNCSIASFFPTEIGFVDLLWLLQLTYKERVDEETLVSWTEKYFETELMKIS